MQIYTLNSVKQMGEADPKYGITFWAEANETLTPLMFNSMSHVGGGQKITCEEQELKTSKKGTEYLRLKKVRVATQTQLEPEKPAEGSVEPQSATQPSTPAANIVMQLDRIEKKIDKLLGLDEVVDVDENETINLDDIPF